MSTDAWYVDEDSKRADIRDENRLLVATAHDFDEARGIVREHNSHDALVAALRRITNGPDGEICDADAIEWCRDIARAALAAAEVQS